MPSSLNWLCWETLFTFVIEKVDERTEKSACLQPPYHPTDARPGIDKPFNVEVSAEQEDRQQYGYQPNQAGDVDPKDRNQRPQGEPSSSVSTVKQWTSPNQFATSRQKDGVSIVEAATAGVEIELGLVVYLEPIFLRLI